MLPTLAKLHAVRRVRAPRPPAVLAPRPRLAVPLGYRGGRSRWSSGTARRKALTLPPAARRPARRPASSPCGTRRTAAFWQSTGTRRRDPEPLDLDPRPVPLVRGLDGLERGRGAAARDRVPLHDQSALLARGAARALRRDAADLLLLHGADLRRPEVDRAHAPPRSSSRRSASASRCRIPRTPYATMLVLALLCGLGGGNFASSMANISFFFPKAQKGTALGLNAGLGNLGVSRCSSSCRSSSPRACSARLGGAPQTVVEGGRAALAPERRVRLGAASSSPRRWPPGSA